MIELDREEFLSVSTYSFPLVFYFDKSPWHVEAKEARGDKMTLLSCLRKAPRC